MENDYVSKPDVTKSGRGEETGEGEIFAHRVARTDFEAGIQLLYALHEIRSLPAISLTLVLASLAAGYASHTFRFLVGGMCTHNSTKVSN